MTTYGTLDDAVLSRVVTLAFQGHALTHDCLDKTLTVRGLFKLMSEHRVGEKDGLCLLQGSCPTGKRSLDNMVSCDVMLLDIDTGMDRDTVCERVQAAGLAAVVWSTHSHGKAASIVKTAALARWCGDAYEANDAVRWLREFKGVEPGILDGAAVSTVDEKTYRVRHRPMDKSRVLLVLAEPFVLRDDADRERWSNLYRGTCARLGLPADPSCADCSRLFFLPRHPKGSTDHASIILAGGVLDLSTVDAVSQSGTGTRRSHYDPNNLFMVAAAGLREGRGGNGVVICNAVDQFLIDNRQTFQFATLYEDYELRTKGRRDHARAGVCPWREMHTDPDDDDDAGFWCRDAVPDKHQAYRAMCAHDGCREHKSDPFWYASKFCEDHGIDIETLGEYV